MFRADCPRRTRRLIDPGRRRQYDRGRRRRHRRAAGVDVQFAGFDFSVARAGRAGGDVHRAVRRGAASGCGRGRRPARAGGGSARGADGAVRDAMRGAERQVVVTRQVPCSACRGAGHVRDAGSDGAARARAPARSAGRAGTWCLRRLRGVRRQRPAALAARAPSARGQGRTVRSEAVPCAVPAGVATAPGCASGIGHAGRRGGRPAIST